MIANPDRTMIVSSAGWVDHDALWCLDVGSGKTESIALGTGARYVTLHATGSERFVVAHHFEGRRFELSVRSFSSPDVVLGRSVLADGESTFAGTPSAWMDVPLLYVEYLEFAPWKDFVLLKVSPIAGKTEVQRLEWYDDSYDKGYQGVIGVLQLPGDGGALVSVQRSSRLILHDLETGRQIRTIHLGDRRGNPRLELRDSGKEVWATDYDTLVVVRTDDWQIQRLSRLQPADAGTQQFIGDFSFVPGQELCAVARPFSGDVVGVDVRTLKIKRSVRLGRQPLEVVALSSGEVIARDWKTGDLLRGTLERRWLAG